MFSEFAEVSAATWGVIVALLLVGVIVFAVSKDKKRWTARMLANGALCIALATVLSFVTLYKMPQGGTITLASMLPIFLFSYAYGVGPGMLVGAAYGFVQFLQGGLYFVHPIELLLDYPLAFAMLGGLVFLQSVRITAGLFKEPAAVSEPLKFGSRLEKDTGVNGLSCGTSLDLTVMPADGTYDCRYLDGHGTLHRDATLVVDGTKAGLYNGQGKTMSAD